MQEIENDAGELFDGLGLVDFDDLAPVNILDHAHAIDAGLSLIAEVDGRAAGFVMGVVYERDAYLHELDVERAHQRGGIGKALVSAFVDLAQARSAASVYLSTFRDPPWNAPFYARVGFQEVARQHYLPWMTAIEVQQAKFLDIRTRVFMRLAL